MVSLRRPIYVWTKLILIKKKNWTKTNCLIIESDELRRLVHSRKILLADKFYHPLLWTLSSSSAINMFWKGSFQEFGAYLYCHGQQDNCTRLRNRGYSFCVHTYLHCKYSAQPEPVLFNSYQSTSKKKQIIWNPIKRKTTEKIQEKYEQIRIKNMTSNLALAAAMFTKSQRVDSNPLTFSLDNLSWSPRHISRVRLPEIHPYPSTGIGVSICLRTPAIHN